MQHLAHVVLQRIGVRECNERLCQMRGLYHTQLTSGGSSCVYKAHRQHAQCKLVCRRFCISKLISAWMAWSYLGAVMCCLSVS